VVGPGSLEEEHHPLATGEGRHAGHPLADAVDLAARLDDGDAPGGAALPRVADLHHDVGDDAAVVPGPGRGAGDDLAVDDVGRSGGEGRGIEPDRGAGQRRARHEEGQEEERSHGSDRNPAREAAAWGM
jgi:hypothetical protein